MELKDQFYTSQIEAIENFYQHMNENKFEEITLSEAIISWFSDGHAEAFREEFFNEKTIMVQN